MARDLATLGHEVEQLKASMEQLKASQQQNFREAASSNLRIRIAATPPISHRRDTQADDFYAASQSRRSPRPGRCYRQPALADDRG